MTMRLPTKHGRCISYPFFSAKLTTPFHLKQAGTADSNDSTIGCSFSTSGACFTDRKLASVRAYHEWLPIRQVVSDDKLRIWRNFQIGKLLVRSFLTSSCTRFLTYLR